MHRSRGFIYTNIKQTDSQNRTFMVSLYSEHVPSAEKSLHFKIEPEWRLLTKGKATRPHCSPSSPCRAAGRAAQPQHCERNKVRTQNSHLSQIERSARRFCCAACCPGAAWAPGRPPRGSPKLGAGHSYLLGLKNVITFPND